MSPNQKVRVIAALAGMAVMTVLALRTADPVVQVTAPLGVLVFAVTLLSVVWQRRSEQQHDDPD